MPWAHAWPGLRPRPTHCGSGQDPRRESCALTRTTSGPVTQVCLVGQAVGRFSGHQVIFIATECVTITSSTFPEAADLRPSSCLPSRVPGATSVRPGSLPDPAGQARAPHAPEMGAPAVGVIKVAVKRSSWTHERLPGSCRPGQLQGE